MIFRSLIINLLTTGVLSLILFSCYGDSSCKKLSLTNEEIAWFDNYKINDSVFFQNEKNIDTFVIDVSNQPEYTTCNRFELGPYTYASMTLYFQFRDKYDSKFGGLGSGYLLSFDKESQVESDKDCFKGVSCFDLTNQNQVKNFDDIPKEGYFIQKTKDSIETYIFTYGKNCRDMDGGTLLVQEFAISKEYGLVWYKTLAGDKYDRIWK